MLYVITNIPLPLSQLSLTPCFAAALHCRERRSTEAERTAARRRLRAEAKKGAPVADVRRGLVALAQTAQPWPEPWSTYN